MTVLAVSVAMTVATFAVYARYGTRVAPLPLWQECAVWFVLIFTMAMEMLPVYIPIACKWVGCS